MEKNQDNNKISTLLMIHYYFPPRGGVAVQRFIKFCKYLQEYNCKVIVLTSGAKYISFRDESLLGEVPKDTVVFTTNSSKTIEGQFGRKNFIIDAFLLWVPVAIAKTNKILKKHKVDVVFVTSPPHSQQIIGLYLKCIKKLPWIADFRDPWSSDLRFMEHKKGLVLNLEKWLERKVLQKADAVIATSRGAVNAFYHKTHNNSPFDKYFLIPNGYDSFDYQRSKKVNSDKIIFSYVGSTGTYISNPSYFLRAIKKLKDEIPSLSNKIQIRFVGGTDTGIKKLVKILQLKDLVIFTGNIPHKKAIEEMQMSDILLLFETPIIPKKPTLVIPSKIFEYIGARRPILAMVVEGDTAELIRRYNAGDVVNPINVNDIYKTIKKKIEQFEEGQMKTLVSAPKEFERKNQASRLSKIIHKLHD